MNEVTVLSTAGELAGRSVGRAVLVARRATLSVGRAGTSLGVALGRTASAAVGDAVRTRRQIVRRGGPVTLPRLRRTTADRRRRWPWVLLALGVLGGGVAVVVLRRPVAPPPAPAPPRVEDVRDDGSEGEQQVTASTS